MFAAFHKLSNLTLIIDDNEISMLGYQRDILGLSPLATKFDAFGWESVDVDGHSIEQLCRVFKELEAETSDKPRVIVARTVKGKGVPLLEGDPLCHVKSLSPDQINVLLKEYE